MSALNWKAWEVRQPAAWAGFGAALMFSLMVLFSASAPGRTPLPWASNKPGEHATLRARLQVTATRTVQPNQLSLAEAVPWDPLLTEEEVQRAQGYYGSGTRLRKLAAKLRAGKPIKAYTLGGSVTRGLGASTPNATYAARFFQIINATFPHKDHVFSNKGIGGTSSGIFAACATQMVPADADLVTVEFAYNDHEAAYTSAVRRGYEQLLRKLLALPGQPAVVMLHYYSWWFTYGDGLDRGLFYYPAEAQMSVFADYYDLSVVSMRAAVWRLMSEGVVGFKPDKVLGKDIKSPTGIPIPQAKPGKEDWYWYSDRMHPSDRGHKTVAEALAGPLLRALAELDSGVARRPGYHRPHPKLQGLPPPMIPNNPDTPTTLCALQEDFRPIVKMAEGFQWRPERPNATSFVEQKWGWTGLAAGAWAELEVDTRADASGSGKGAGDSASIWLTYLRSYTNMGKARVECAFGCSCKRSYVDGSWWRRESLQQIHSFKVSQHQTCRIRVTILANTDGGSKFSLQGIMVTGFPIRLTVYAKQVEDLGSETVSSSSSSGIARGDGGS